MNIEDVGSVSAKKLVVDQLIPLDFKCIIDINVFILTRDQGTRHGHQQTTVLSDQSWSGANVIAHVTMNLDL